MSWKRDQFWALISQCTRSRFVFWLCFMELPECCCSQTEAELLNLLCFSGSLWVFQDPWFCLGSMLPFIPSECCRNPGPWHPECNRGTTQAIPREPFPIKWELQLWAKLTSSIKFHFRASSWLLQCLQPWILCSSPPSFLQTTPKSSRKCFWGITPCILSSLTSSIAAAPGTSGSNSRPCSSYSLHQWNVYSLYSQPSPWQSLCCQDYSVLLNWVLASLKWCIPTSASSCTLSKNQN